MIHRKHLREIIGSTLKDIELYSESALELVYGTICVESKRGTYLKQLRNGPALGIVQMEPNTHSDIWKNYLAFNPGLTNKIIEICGSDAMKPQALVYNLKYAIIMCRIHYYRIQRILPEKNDLRGLAIYWKQYYNTNLGAGTVDDFIKNYNLK